jgi:hypothetical protein
LDFSFYAPYIEEKLPFTIEKEEKVEGELFPRPKTIQENIKFSDIIERKIPDRAFGFGPANSKIDSSLSLRCKKIEVKCLLLL